MANQRTYFRLEYPQPERPRLKLPAGDFEVVDVSEKGLKFECGQKYRPTEGGTIKGTLTFRDGKTCEVAGTVLRFLAEKRQCVLTLTKGIPLAKMMEEQRYLLQKYKP